MNAKREAMARKRDNNGLNAGEVAEFAYSPATGAVGIRWTGPNGPNGRFLVFNIHYPMYGQSDRVTDWVSVGPCTEKRS